MTRESSYVKITTPCWSACSVAICVNNSMSAGTRRCWWERVLRVRAWFFVCFMACRTPSMPLMCGSRALRQSASASAISVLVVLHTTSTATQEGGRGRRAVPPLAKAQPTGTSIPEEKAGDFEIQRRQEGGHAARAHVACARAPHLTSPLEAPTSTSRHKQNTLPFLCNRRVPSRCSRQAPARPVADAQKGVLHRKQQDEQVTSLLRRVCVAWRRAAAPRHTARDGVIAARKGRGAQIVGSDKLHARGGGGGAAQLGVVRRTRGGAHAGSHEIASAHERRIDGGAAALVEAVRATTLLWLHQCAIVRHRIRVALRGAQEKQALC